MNVPLRLPLLLAAAAANHIALSIPSSDLTLWEQEALKDVHVEKMKTSIWMKSGMHACKAIVWFSAAYELAVYFVRADPWSPLSQHLLSWLPEIPVDVLQDNNFGLTLQTSSGLLLIAAGALMHMSARYSLGVLAQFPLIAKSAVSSRHLYIPPAYSPARDFLGRAQEPEKDSAKLASNESRVQWTLRPAHELVKSGPYGFVRHPMYAGTALALAGSTLIHFAPGSVTRTLISCSNVPSPDFFSGFWDLRPDAWTGWDVMPLGKITWAGVAAFTLGLAILGTIVGLVRMARKEDEALAERFDKRWAIYRWNVGAMFVPGLF